ncbi:MAG: MBL fold metallo-hydrolase [Planctomycetaceae bacterium]|nr:MBL fold metallo-hydrolase [Planctomycetales bacterium]MCB9923272.1 MBL fold metallo-hydrolase [Planctomycetaceae bacterium]
MKVIALQSGSNGNCIYVESKGVRLLFDAGISGKQAQSRLAAHGRDIADVDALVISHDHRDHVRCMGIYQRKFGLPIHTTKETLAAAQRSNALGPLNDVRHFASGAILRFGSVTVETIPTPHDAVDGVAFVVDDGTKRLGILTDLGHPFDQLISVMQTLDAVVLESNYDPEMLTVGPYPEFLQERIRGTGGHLSNFESAELICGVNGKLRWACLAHLSEENNDPDLAVDTHRDILGKRFPLIVASRHGATDVLEV